MPLPADRLTYRIYLIEDDLDLRSHLSATLSDHGLQVSEFSSAEDFLDGGVDDSSPAVIVSDMILPGVSGIRLLETVRAAGIATPLIFISGYSTPAQIIEGMKLGAVDFLWKPFKADVLIHAVMQSLRADGQRLVQHAQQQDIAVRWAALTEREQEVCKLLLRGFGNKDISIQLGIQPDTANKHHMKVMSKLGAETRSQLIDLLKGFQPAQQDSLTETSV